MAPVILRNELSEEPVQESLLVKLTNTPTKAARVPLMDYLDNLRRAYQAAE